MNDGKLMQYTFRKAVLSLTAVFVLLLAYSSLLQYYPMDDNESSSRVEINIKKKGYGDPLHIEDISTLQKQFPKSAVSFINRNFTELRSGATSLDVKVGLTNHNYSAFPNLLLSRGTFITEDSYIYGRNVVIISEALAAELFMRLDVIGNEIELFNTPYTIAGLYKQEESVISLMASDGYHQVYIPFTSHPEMSSLPLDTIFIGDESLTQDIFKKKSMEEILLRSFNLTPGTYKIVSYDKAFTLLSQFNNLFLFCVSLGIIFMLILALKLFVRNRLTAFKNYLNVLYFKEFLKKKLFSCILSILGLLSFLGAITFVFMASLPEIFIPSQYLPQENIFDIRFYAEQIKTAIEHGNAAVGYTPTVMERSFHTIFIINLLLMLLAAPVFFSFRSGINLLKHLTASPITYIKVYIMSVTLAVALGMLMTALGAFTLVIPLKAFLIISVFYTLKMVIPSSKS